MKANQLKTYQICIKDPIKHKKMKKKRLDSITDPQEKHDYCRDFTENKITLKKAFEDDDADL